MATARNRRIALLVTLLVVAAGCSRAGSEPGPTASIATTAPSEAASATPAPTEAASPDPYAIPADPKDIDAAYVERVLEALLTSLAKSGRVVAREGRVTPDVKRILSTTHRTQAANHVVQAFRDVVRRRLIRAVLSPNARPPEIRVQRVLGASEVCVFTRVVQDTSPMGGQEIKPFPAYYHLVAKSSGAEDAGNPTPWMIAADAEPRADGKEYANPCK